MKRLQVFIAALIFFAHASLAQASDTLTPRAVMSVVDREIKACGIALDFMTEAHDLVVTLSNRKHTKGVKTLLTVRSKEPVKTADANTRVISDVEIKTASLSTSDILKSTKSEPPAEYQAAAHLPSGDFSSLFQQLLVGGGQVSVTVDGKRWTREISGPSPNSVRAEYLMCSGDLYRPERLRDQGAISDPSHAKT